MEKLKTASIYQSILLLALLLCGGVSMAETNYSTKDNYTGNWTNDVSWTDGTALGTTLGTEAVNITINGEITVSALTISGTENVNLIVNDTLIIEGDLTVNGTGIFDLDITSPGYFIVRGNFVINTDGATSYDFVGGGFFGVRGNYSISGSETGGMNSDRKYVMGSENSSDYDFRNRNDLVNYEAATTRKLLFGIQAVGFDADVTQPICNGESNGSITIQGIGGTWGYQYNINNTTWIPDGSYTGDSHTFSGLAAGDYTIYVRDDLYENYSQNVNVPVKEVLAFSVAQPNLCAGEIEVTVSGGNPDYTVNVSGTEQTGAGPFTFSSLSAGDVTVTVVDDESCPSTPASETFTVQVDAAAPQFADFPADQQVLYSDYESFASLQTGVSVITDNNSNTLSHNGSFDYGPVDLSNYTNATMDFTFTVTNGTAGVNDIITLSYSYDGSIFTPLPTTFNSQNGTEIFDVVLPLNALPSDNNSVTIRVSGDFQTGGLSYEFTNFEITADEVFSTTNIIAPAALPSCTDDVSSCNDSPTSTDAAPIWLCNSGLIKEFYFIRTWRIVDNCAKETTRQQRVSVGTAPTITAANDTTIDFCNAGTITLPNPTVNDDCSPLANLTITWEIFDGNMVSTGLSGSAPLAAELAYSATQDTVYTVTWTVTDQAGFFATDNQTITIKPVINIDIEYPAYNFCSREEVIFYVTIAGGTDFYDAPTFNIAGVWSGNANNSSGTFTTSALGLEPGLFNEFTITVNDVTTSSPNPEITGGCSSGGFSFSDGNGGGEFDIHEKISTNEVERFD